MHKIKIFTPNTNNYTLLIADANKISDGCKYL